jgi:hypothetical protein
MQILDDDCIFIDVDETLIIPENEECFVPKKPNLKLIEKIREWKDKGRTIIVWTSNPDGVKHCKKAIYLCGIEEEVNFVMPKPRTIVDDDHLEYYNIIDPITLEWRDR